MSRKISMILKWLVSLGLIAFLVYKVDISSLVTELLRTNIFLFSTAVIIAASTILIKSYKWQLLLKIQGANISLRSIQAITYMSIFFNNFFLGSLGGDVFKIYRTKAYSTLKSGAFSSVLMDRITGLPMLFVTVGFAGLINTFEKNPVVTLQQLSTIVLLGLGVFILIGALFFVISKFNRVSIFSRFPKFERAISDFRAAMIAHNDHKQTVVVSLLLSWGFYLANSVVIYFFALSVGVTISIFHLFFIVPLVLLLVMLPISINGIGVQEGAFVFYFEKIGVDASQALIIALLPRIVMLIFSLVGALIYLSEDYGKKRVPEKSADKGKTI